MEDCENVLAGRESVNLMLDGKKQGCDLIKTQCTHKHVSHIQTRRVVYLRYGDLNVVYKPSFTPNNSQHTSLNHGRRSSTHPGTIAPPSAAKPSRSAAPEPVPRSKRHLPLKTTPSYSRFYFKSHSPYISLLFRHVARLDRKTRSYLIYLSGPLHIRLPVSAALRTFVVRRFSLRSSTNRTRRVVIRATLTAPLSNFISHTGLCCGTPH